MSAASVSDVVIVGAGPAGSSAGLLLARAGYNVTFIERSQFPRTKVCGDYLCSGAVATLHNLGIADTVLAGAQPIRTVTLNGFGLQLQLALPGDGAYSLTRAMLDERLLQHAQSAGARMLRGVYLGSNEEGEGVRVAFRDATGIKHELCSRALVGADGAWSLVAQRNGMVTDFRRFGRWAVGGKLTDEAAGHELTMHIGSEGYYARNPLDSQTMNTMLVLGGPPRPEAADGIVEQLTGGKQRFELAKIHKLHAIGPLRYRSARVASGRVLLTGDAAEFLDPFTGQGVATALALSFVVCDAVRALLAGQSPTRVGRRYQARWRATVEPRRKLTQLVSAAIHIPALRARALRRMQGDPHMALELLSSITGTQPAQAALTPPMLWRLFAA